MAVLDRAPITAVVQQHVDDAVMLAHIRSRLAGAPHVRLLQLGRIDERIDAHLDGLAVAGAFGDALLRASATFDAPSEVFVAGVRALEEGNRRALERLLAIAEGLPAVQPGLLAAFGWVPAPRLRGVTPPLLGSATPLHRVAGLFACRAHRIDPGPALAPSLDDPSPLLRARALRVAGEAGRTDQLAACRAGLGDSDGHARFAAARAAVLLGDRRSAIGTLDDLVIHRAAGWPDALCLLMQILPPDESRARLRVLHGDDGARRELIRAVGVAGDAHFVTWLIEQMTDPRLARLAGEAFALITGTDLARDDLETVRPADFESGPNDDPDDEDVSMDEDDDLPWPDIAKIRNWWQRHAARFPPGLRRLMGTPPDAASCLAVLRDGGQRQRWLAAIDRVLLAPGTDLFPIAAPTRRQRRWLAELGVSQAKR